MLPGGIWIWIEVMPFPVAVVDSRSKAELLVSVTFRPPGGSRLAYTDGSPEAADRFQ